MVTPRGPRGQTTELHFDTHTHTHTYTHVQITHCSVGRTRASFGRHWASFGQWLGQWLGTDFTASIWSNFKAKLIRCHWLDSAWYTVEARFPDPVIQWFNNKRGWPVSKQVNTVFNVHRNHKAYSGRGERGKREIIYLSLHCHHQNDSCIEMGSDESHFNVSLIVRDKVTRHSCIKMGSDESHFKVSLTVRDKVTRQCPQTTTFEEKGEPKRIRTEVLLLTSLTPYR